MEPKKVGSITLEYDRGDGVIESQAFDAEFQNALITGDISALTGTFDGKLDANAVNAVSNLNIAGKAVATTDVRTRAVASPESHGFNDDGVYRSLMDAAIEVPQGMNGAWAAVTMQYGVKDNKGSENGGFPCQYRILVDGVAYFTSAVEPFFWWFRRFDNHLHEMLLYLSGAGTHTVALQYRWFDEPTNVYPQFNDLLYRIDLIRK